MMILNTSIALRIRWRSLSVRGASQREGKSRKPIVVGFAVLLMVSQLCSGCNRSKSDYSFQAEGSCKQQTSIRIIDESNGLDPNARMDYSPRAVFFTNYVDTISKYVFTKIDEMGQCKDNPQVELIFIYRPLLKFKGTPFNFEQIQSDDFKQLDSPWVKLSMSRSSKLIVRAAFLWNERQFLLDQAILSDPQIVPIKPLLPLEGDSYSKSINDYMKSSDEPSEEAEAAARVKLFKRLPPDIIWLFLHSGSFDGQSNARGAIDKTIRERADRYIDITKILIDRRFSSGQAEQHYESVLDLKDVFNLDKYRIDPLTIIKEKNYGFRF